MKGFCFGRYRGKKREKKREREQWEGGETENPALWDSSVCFGGGQSGFVRRTSPDTEGSDAVSCSLCVSVVKPDLPLIPAPHTLLHLLPRSLPSASSGLNPL